MSATPFTRLGQRGWAHDEGHASGVFHTYDALDVHDTFGPRKVHVFLPRHLEHPLPVVYLHDGDAVFWPGGAVGRTWDVAGALDRMGAALPPMIFVAVHPIDRNAEYTHVDWAEGRRSWGRLPEYTQTIVEHLKPFIDAAYPTRPEARATAVIGSSHGGLASFFIATRRPDRVGFAGCMSSSFFSGLDSLRTGKKSTPLIDAALLRPVVKMLADRSRRPKLWLDWGLIRQGGEHNSVVEALATLRGREMAGLLSERWGYRRQDVIPGLPPRPDAELWVQEDPGGAHDEDAWGRRLPGVLLAFAER